MAAVENLTEDRTMDEKKITKFALGCGLLLLFFRFYYDFQSKAVQDVVLLALAAFTVVSDGLPALIRFGIAKKFGRQEIIFTMLYIVQAVALICTVTSSLAPPPIILLLILAAVLIVWQSIILNPLKKEEKKI
jgi:hypothetical protein